MKNRKKNGKYCPFEIYILFVNRNNVIILNIEVIIVKTKYILPTLPIKCL